MKFDNAIDEWEMSTLGSMCSRITTGSTPSRSVNEYFNGHIPWVKTQELLDSAIEHCEEHITELALKHTSVKLLPANTVLMAMYGATVGKLGIVKIPVTCNQACCALIPDDSVLDFRFLFYLLLQNRDGIRSLATGAAQQNLSVTTIKEYQFRFPPLHEQKAIAHILGSLDDKIDLLRKTNTVLEDMASALFKSWFVDFDPVKAKQENRPTGLPKDLDDLFPDSFEDSALGPIPKGWRVGCVGDVCHIHDSRRKPLSSKERQAMQGCYPYYGAASVLDYVNSYLFDGIYLLLGEDGSVVQKDGTPVLQYVWDKFWVSNHAHVLTGKGISTEQLLIALRSINISPFVTGAVQPKVSQGNMKSIPLVLPDERIANELDRLIIPNYGTYRVNIHQIRTLTNLRDTLLPKLISGELRVPDAEQMVAELGL